MMNKKLYKMIMVIMFNTTFNNISAILLPLVYLEEETRAPGENC